VKLKNIIIIFSVVLIILSFCFNNSIFATNTKTSSTIFDGSNNFTLFSSSRNDEITQNINNNLYNKLDTWPTFRGGVEHNGINLNSRIPNDNQTLWIYNANNSIKSSPTTIGNLIYFGTVNGTILCLSIENGTEIWRQKVERIEYSSPAIYNGSLVIGTTSGKVYCLNSSTGDILWDFSTEGEIQGSPTIFNESVFITSYDGNIYSLDLANGSLNWNISTSGWVHTSPTIWNGIIYFGGCDGFVHAVHLNGTSLWDLNTGDYVISTPAVYNGSLYFGTHSNKIFCMNALTKEIIWENVTDGPIRASPAISGKNIIFADWNNQIYNFNSLTGELLWNFKTGGKIYSSPSISNDKLVFGSDDFKIYCLYIANGTEVWSYITGEPVESSPAITRDRIYIGSSDGNLYCFGTENVQINLPKTVIETPKYNQMISNLELEIQGETFPGDLPITNVEIRLNNGNWIKANGTEDWKISLNLSGLANKNHYITARSFDGIYYSPEVLIAFKLNYTNEDNNNNGTGNGVKNSDESEEGNFCPFTNIYFLIFIIISVFLLLLMIISSYIRKKFNED
jgi:outer membrane protein assembly factor BamB